jgi:bifunctional DNA-binding transcriptional regulator/antitoxin component of YhaV-PrlF toxin-antitoxin module
VEFEIGYISKEGRLIIPAGIREALGMPSDEKTPVSIELDRKSGIISVTPVAIVPINQLRRPRALPMQPLELEPEATVPVQPS